MSATADLRDEEMSLPVTDEEVNQGVLDAYIDRGYSQSTDQGEVQDRVKMAKSILPLIVDAVVNDKSERKTKAVRRGQLLRAAFPDTPGPGSSEYEASELTQKVWKKLDQQVWNEAKPDHTSRIQKWVGENNRGLVMCRTVIEDDGTSHDAVYVTTNIDLIKVDFGGPLKDKVRNATAKLAENFGMVSKRQPKHRKLIEREVDSGMKAASGLAKNTLALSAGSSEDDAETE
jgi:hypothetical protein